MNIVTILIILGYINTVIGRCSKEEENKVFFSIVGIMLLVLAIIIWITDILK